MGIQDDGEEEGGEELEKMMREEGGGDEEDDYGEELVNRSKGKATNKSKDSHKRE